MESRDHKLLPKVVWAPPQVPTQKGPHCNPSLTEAPGVQDAAGIPASLGLWTPHSTGRTHPKLRVQPARACGKRANFSPTDSQLLFCALQKGPEAAPEPEARLVCGDVPQKQVSPESRRPRPQGKPEGWVESAWWGGRGPRLTQPLTVWVTVLELEPSSPFEMWG